MSYCKTNHNYYIILGTMKIATRKTLCSKTLCSRPYGLCNSLSLHTADTYRYVPISYDAYRGTYCNSCRLVTILQHVPR